MADITTNTTATNSQQYGINIDTTNSDALSLYSYQDIVWDVRSGEGVFSGVLNGEDKFITSRSIIKTLDLISEGEIEGLVSGEYIAQGNNPAGQLGFESRPFVPYGNEPEAFLRSVYLNDTPVVNKNNQYNFQQKHKSTK